MINKNALLAGSIFGLTGVIIGALGAHYLKTIFTAETLQSFGTGVRYQGYHALALLFLGIYAKENPQYIKWIFRFFVIGIILFSGSIYALSFLKGNTTIGLTGIGVLTPVGGMFFIAGWILLLLSIMKINPK